MVLDLGTSTANLAFESVPLASDTKVRVFFVDISFWLLKSLLIPLHLPPPLAKKKNCIPKYRGIAAIQLRLYGPQCSQ